MLVRIRNRADQDIAIIDNSVNQPIYMLAYSPHLDAVWNAQTGESPYRIIRPDGVADLLLITRAKDGQPMDNDARVWVKIFLAANGLNAMAANPAVAPSKNE